MDWKQCEARTQKDRLPGCFISPDGRWYNVDYGFHASFSWSVIQEIYPDKYDRLQHYREPLSGPDLLCSFGWIRVYYRDGPIRTSALLINKPNEIQLKALKQYWKKKPVFSSMMVEQYVSERFDD
jgi:hypothetical protein